MYYATAFATLKLLINYRERKIYVHVYTYMYLLFEFGGNLNYQILGILEIISIGTASFLSFSHLSDLSHILLQGLALFVPIHTISPTHQIQPNSHIKCSVVRPSLPALPLSLGFLTLLPSPQLTGPFDTTFNLCTQPVYPHTPSTSHITPITLVHLILLHPNPLPISKSNSSPSALSSA